MRNEFVENLWPEEGERVVGFDPRPVDGAVFSIRAPGKGVLSIGELCGRDDPECSDEDQALLDLRRTFYDLEDQALASPGCAHLEP